MDLFGIDLGRLLGVISILTLLLITSYYFNKQIDKAGNRAEDMDWVLVVIGTVYTQIGIGILDFLLPQWNAALLGLMAYCFSGLPMIWGAYQRHTERRDRAEKALHE